MESNFLTPDQLLAQGELPSAAINVPEWGGTVRVRRWTAIERDRYDKESLEIENGGGETKQNVRARLVAHCLIDEEGKQLFLTAAVNGTPPRINPEATAALGQRDANGLARVYRVCRNLNPFLDDLLGPEEDEGN